ncbi:unnamed protein product [Calypogeia fissa]
MEDKDWFWQDDSYKLDTESPLAISRSLWDGLAQSEADSRSLFATTPSTEIIDSDHLVSTFSRKVGLDAEVDASCSSMYDADSNSTEGSPRSKRRRMLLFPGATEESSAMICDSSSSFEAPAGLDSSYRSQCATMIPTCELELDRYDVSMPTSSLWYQHEDPHFSLNEVLDNPQKWMVRSSSGFSGNDPSDPMKLIIPVSDNSGSCSSDCQQPSSSDSNAMDWPSTPFSLSPNSGTRPRAPPNARPKSATPVAYPFALLKPCGAQGDLTLNDINQRIARPPPPPPPSQLQQQPQQHNLRGDSRPSPHHRHHPGMSQSGGSPPARSGKSVVGLTKIHTEGNGTITIVRTRGV